jgi:hypothetical protein
MSAKRALSPLSHWRPTEAGARPMRAASLVISINVLVGAEHTVYDADCNSLR